MCGLRAGSNGFQIVAVQFVPERAVLHLISQRIWETFRPCAVWRCAYRRAYWRAYWWRMVLRVRTLSSGVSICGSICKLPKRYLTRYLAGTCKVPPGYLHGHLEAIYRLSRNYLQAISNLPTSHRHAIFKPPRRCLHATCKLHICRRSRQRCKGLAHTERGGWKHL